MKLSDFRLTRFTLPLERVIGDSQVRFEKMYLCVLELQTDTGLTGSGFMWALQSALPPLAELERVFKVDFMPALLGEQPQVLLNRISAPRGGNRYSSTVNFATTIDHALWDLTAKSLDMPLHELFGGTGNQIPVYASMLGFHSTDDEVKQFYRKATKLGFRGFKVKVGFDTVEQDLQRLQAVYDVVPAGSTIMIDTNEGWTSREAIRRLLRYREEGFAIYWTEDPILRHDFVGLREIKQSVPYTYVNAGEYLDTAGRRALIESKSIDVLNMNGKLSDNLKLAWLAEQYDIALALGNTEFEIGAHLALSLPLVGWMEYSSLNYRHLFDSYITFEDGYVVPPQLAGHGIQLSETAQDYAVPDEATDTSPQDVPASPISAVNLSDT